MLWKTIYQPCTTIPIRQCASFFVLASVLFFVALPSHAFPNGVAMKPPLGWSTWCGRGGCGADWCSETDILQTVDHLQGSGLAALGYTLIMIDDCWSATRRDPTTDALVWDATRFPRGMPWLIQTLHVRGFNVSLYVSLGDVTCDRGGRNSSIPGSQSHYALDVSTFIAWGVDGIIADCCGSCRQTNFNATAAYMNFSRVVWTESVSARHGMYLQGDAALEYLLWDVGAYYNSWQAFSDHHDVWASTADTIDMMSSPWTSVPGQPGAWSYMDVLMTGGQGCKGGPPVSPPHAHCPGQTDVEYRTEYTMWALLQSPLIIGTDVQNLTEIMRAVLFNDVLIEVHQDTSTPPGAFIAFDESCVNPLVCELWARPLKQQKEQVDHTSSKASGPMASMARNEIHIPVSTTSNYNFQRYLIVLFNSGNVSTPMQFPFKLIGWTAKNQSVHTWNIWTRVNQTVAGGGQIGAVVEAHGVAGYIITV